MHSCKISLEMPLLSPTIFYRQESYIEYLKRNADFHISIAQASANHVLQCFIAAPIRRLISSPWNRWPQQRHVAPQKILRARHPPLLIHINFSCQPAGHRPTQIGNSSKADGSVRVLSPKSVAPTNVAHGDADCPRVPQCGRTKKRHAQSACRSLKMPA